MKDRLEAAAAREETHPFIFRAPYEGIPKDVTGNFVWVPFKEEGYAIVMFDDEDDRDAYASRFDDEDMPVELRRRRRRRKKYDEAA